MFFICANSFLDLEHKSNINHPIPPFLPNIKKGNSKKKKLTREVSQEMTEEQIVEAKRTKALKDAMKKAMNKNKGTSGTGVAAGINEKKGRNVVGKNTSSSSTSNNTNSKSSKQIKSDHSSKTKPAYSEALEAESFGKYDPPSKTKTIDSIEIDNKKDGFSTPTLKLRIKRESRDLNNEGGGGFLSQSPVSNRNISDSLK